MTGIRSRILPSRNSYSTWIINGLSLPRHDDWRPRVLFFLKGTLGSPERTGPDILWRLPGNFIRFG